MEENYVEVDGVFKYCDITYRAKEVPHDAKNPYYKCKMCDLNYKGYQKLCLSNYCKCGECFGWERKDGNDIIFLVDDGISKEYVEKMIEARKKLAKMEVIEEENRRLRERNKKLTETNMKLVEQCQNYEKQLGNIYANINKAIKAEVYKFMTKK